MSQPKNIEFAFSLHYQDFALQVQASLPGQGVTVIYGPSGSGKTTLLRLLAGLEKTPTGNLSLNGEVWQNAQRFTPVHERRAGFVFQHPNLLPHLSVNANLEFARQDTNKGFHSFDELVDICGLRHLLQRMPAQLSGGEKQRASIAAALLTNPKVLLMDEPISALDQSARRIFLNFLTQLKQTLPIPVLYVTHSIDELARLADTVLLMQNGSIQTCGPAKQVLSHISDFLAEDDLVAIVDAEVVEKKSDWQLARFRFDAGDIWVGDQDFVLHKHYHIKVQARDVSVTLSQHQDSSILNSFSAYIDAIKALESGGVLLKLKAGSTVFLAKITRWSAESLALRQGQTLYMQVKSVAVMA